MIAWYTDVIMDETYDGFMKQRLKIYNYVYSYSMNKNNTSIYKIKRSFDQKH